MDDPRAFGMIPEPLGQSQSRWDDPRAIGMIPELSGWYQNHWDDPRTKARLDTARSKNQGMALANFGDQPHKEQLSTSFGCGSSSPASQNFIPQCPAGKTEQDPSIPAPQRCFQKELYGGRNGFLQVPNEVRGIKGFSFSP